LDSEKKFWILFVFGKVETRPYLHIDLTGDQNLDPTDLVNIFEGKQGKYLNWISDQIIGLNIIRNKLSEPVIKDTTPKKDGMKYYPKIELINIDLEISWDEFKKSNEKQVELINFLIDLTLKLDTSMNPIIEEMKKDMPNQNNSTKTVSTKVSEKEFKIYSDKIEGLFKEIEFALEKSGQIILYGPPGTGKTFIAKEFIKNHFDKKQEDVQIKIEDVDFDGFDPNIVKLYKRYKESGLQTEFYLQNIKPIYTSKIKNPLNQMRNVLKEFFFNRINFPKFQSDISRPNKNYYGEVPSSNYYHPYMWAVFYRTSVNNKKDDAQLFFSISNEGFHAGLSFGESNEGKKICDNFIQNIEKNLDALWNTYLQPEKMKDLTFTNNMRNPKIKVTTKEELNTWLSSEKLLDIILFYPDTALSQPSSLINKMLDLYRTLYPLYLIAIYQPSNRNLIDYIDSCMESLENMDNSIDEAEFEIKESNSDESESQKNFEFITFHQSYSYEEFVEGIFPQVVLPSKTNKDQSNSGISNIKYYIKPGIFKNIVDRARLDYDVFQKKAHPYYLVIDEINRGNISKIFGELITLIEKDKRLSPKNEQTEIYCRLPYSGEEFIIPPNLFIIGTMNTADRSIALMDYALRRRFAFIECMPDPDVINSSIPELDISDLKIIFKTLNSMICSKLGRDFQIGHSYFMNLENIEELKFVWYYKIIPLLQEYLYDNQRDLFEILPGFLIRTTMENDDSDYEVNEYRIDEEIKKDNTKFLEILKKNYISKNNESK